MALHTVITIRTHIAAAELGETPHALCSIHRAMRLDEMVEQGALRAAAQRGLAQRACDQLRVAETHIYTENDYFMTKDEEKTGTYSHPSDP